jgi:hypothetical protein
MISQEEEIEVLLNDCHGGWQISNKANKLYELRRTKDSNNNIRKRSDPILVQIYKELGDEFDGGNHSKTGIEKIPKKYEKYYIISEYDVLESVEIDYTLYELDHLKQKIKEILENNDIDNDEKIKQLTNMNICK